jgi:phosphoribosylformylglycinamidine synthase subunit PurQ / glutaminase
MSPIAAAEGATNAQMQPVRFGIVVFPGSNCDTDAHRAVSGFSEAEARFLWHKDTDLADLDAIVLPGGFSYGDYLRCGAIARFSPIMARVSDFAAAGGLVLGICNGFQILTEAGLLPGALIRNTCLTFVCRYVNLRVETTATPFTSACEQGDRLRIIVKHNEGNYTADPETLERMRANGQIVLRYVDGAGETTPQASPNGAVENIAGVCNEARNVFGMMPHPENSVDAGLAGGTDGRAIFRSIIDTVRARGAGEAAAPAATASSTGVAS